MTIVFLLLTLMFGYGAYRTLSHAFSLASVTGPYGEAFDWGVLATVPLALLALACGLLTLASLVSGPPVGQAG